MTLAYDPVGKIGLKGHSMPNYIAATASDTTATVNGKVIDNRTGEIEAISATINNTAKRGTNPTLKLTAEFSNNNGASWATLKDTGNADILTSTYAIASASSRSLHLNSVEGLTNYPQLIRFTVAVGGTSTPGWTGNVGVNVIRRTRTLNS